jgi:hypothetical protein
VDRLEARGCEVDRLEARGCPLADIVKFQSRLTGNLD